MQKTLKLPFQNKLRNKFLLWESLMDTSIYFAIAGMKARGLSMREIKKKLFERWQKASREHHQANLEIARRIYGKRIKAQ